MTDRRRQIGARIVRESIFPYFRKKMRLQFRKIRKRIKKSPKKELSILLYFIAISLSFKGSLL